MNEKRLTGTTLPKTDSRGQRALAGVSRIRVLEALRAAGPNASVITIAARVGLHPNTVRWHLDRLVRAGLATRESAPPDKPGRPPVHFTATSRASAAGDEADESGYQLLARILASYLATTVSSDAAVAAGESYGHAAIGPSPEQTPDGRTATARVVELLDEMGFAPEPQQNQIRLHACPFRAVAHTHPDVVCATHLGLMRGAFAALGAPVQTSAVEPFTPDGSCLAYLTTGDTAGAPDSEPAVTADDT